MARLRYNGLSTTLAAALTNSATSVTLAASLTHSGGTAVPTIGGSDYLPLSILDGTGKVSEIVYLTAYTSGASTGTITRGQEGTSGVAHASGDRVVHGPTVMDSSATVGCSAYLTSVVTATSGVEASIALNVEAFDSHGFHSNTTNSTRITVPAGLDGVYIVVSQVKFAYNASGSRAAQIRKNGTKIYELGFQGSISSRAQATLILPLVAGDYIEAGYFQDSGSDLALDTAGECKLTVLRAGS